MEKTDVNSRADDRMPPMQQVPTDPAASHLSELVSLIWHAVLNCVQLRWNE